MTVISQRAHLFTTGLGKRTLLPLISLQVISHLVMKTCLISGTSDSCKSLILAPKTVSLDGHLRCGFHQGTGQSWAAEPGVAAQGYSKPATGITARGLVMVPALPASILPFLGGVFGDAGPRLLLGNCHLDITGVLQGCLHRERFRSFLEETHLQNYFKTGQ